jgi:hypothetical protein
MATVTKRRYTPPKPAPLPEDYEEFYATLTEAERELDALAKNMLGSSYFIQWSHMYLKWSKTKEEKTQSEKTKEEKAKETEETEEKKE